MPEGIMLLQTSIVCLAILLRRARGGSCQYLRIFLKWLIKKNIKIKRWEEKKASNKLFKSLSKGKVIGLM